MVSARTEGRLEIMVEEEVEEEEEINIVVSLRPLGLLWRNYLEEIDIDIEI